MESLNEMRRLALIINSVKYNGTEIVVVEEVVLGNKYRLRLPPGFASLRKQGVEIPIDEYEYSYDELAAHLEEIIVEASKYIIDEMNDQAHLDSMYFADNTH